MPRELKKILAVDDEESIRELLEDFLTFQGYEVETASNGEDALLAIEAKPPDLVLLDIKMPGKSGIEVLRKIKALQADIGVVMLSAFGDLATIKEARKLGSDFYLQKPVNLKHLQEYLHTWKNQSARKLNDRT
jgi:two-component system response regulator (stage 0 sporulation protein F)